jgi:uncharacterized protein (DUF169 family)
MESRIARELKLRHQPVAVLFSDERPEAAAQFKEKKWACVMSMLAASARGITAVFDRKTTGCFGGMTGLCLGDGSKGRDLAGFLSAGRTGLGYFKSKEVASTHLGVHPPQDIPEKYVLFKPLSKVDPEKEKPKVVIFLANADQLAALSVMAHYDRKGGEAVAAPFGSGCSAVCLLPYLESKKRTPRAILGGLDVSARPWIDPDLLTFSVPYAMFQKMEANVPGSFLERESWSKLKERIP